jgi:putative phosphoesterase
VKRVGVLSDTHGLLRPPVLPALAGCDIVIHAGDVGGAAILDALRDIAPVYAVRGNIDRGPWAASLPETESLEIEGRFIHVLHDVARLDFDPAEAGFDAVVSGHSHQPLVERRESVLYLNPGSAGPRRFTLPVTLAIMTVSTEAIEARIVGLLDA